ncbi:hypothetical protein B0H12DRAFT_453909 [Mycena haematopus]|nr:hypothetical protein B0H12DRAFT_453909 [Mycena haematopus]
MEEVEGQAGSMIQHSHIASLSEPSRRQDSSSLHTGRRSDSLTSVTPFVRYTSPTYALDVLGYRPVCRTLQFTGTAGSARVFVRVWRCSVHCLRHVTKRHDLERPHGVISALRTCARRSPILRAALPHARPPSTITPSAYVTTLVRPFFSFR